MQTTADYQKQARSEIRRLYAQFDGWRAGVINTLAAIAAANSATGQEPPPGLKTAKRDPNANLDSTERRHAVRSKARELLSGGQPKFAALPAERSDKNTSNAASALLAEIPRPLYESEARIELEAIEECLQLFTRKDTEAEAADRVQFGEANAGEWRAISRQLILAMAAVEQLAERAANFAAKANGAGLPLVEYLAGPISINITDVNFAILSRAAIAEGVVTRKELERASHGER